MSFILAEITNEVSQSATELSMSPAAWGTLAFMVVTITGGLSWSLYRAVTASRQPDEKQYPGEE